MIRSDQGGGQPALDLVRGLIAPAANPCYAAPSPAGTRPALPGRRHLNTASKILSSPPCMPECTPPPAAR